MFEIPKILEICAEEKVMPLTYRKGTVNDSQAVFQVFTQSIMDLGTRTNTMA